MKNRTNLNLLNEVVYISFFYHIVDSWLYWLDGCLYLWWHDRVTRNGKEETGDNSGDIHNIPSSPNHRMHLQIVWKAGQATTTTFSAWITTLLGLSVRRTEYLVQIVLTGFSCTVWILIPCRVQVCCLYSFHSLRQSLRFTALQAIWFHSSSLLSERHEASTVSVQLKRSFATFTPGQKHRRTFFLRWPSPNVSWLSPLSLCQNKPSSVPLPEYNSCSFPSSYFHHNALWSTMRGQSKTITLSLLTYPLNLIPVLWTSRKA